MSGARALGRRLGRAVTPSCGWREQFRRLRQRLIWAAVVLTVISVPLIAFAPVVRSWGSRIEIAGWQWPAIARAATWPP